MQPIADIRKDYKQQSLLEKDVAANPFVQFEQWWNQATNSQIDEVNAMTLATANTEGTPQARIVLLKGYSDKGFVFYTNYESNKGKELAKNPKAALVFFWKELERQVRISGTVQKNSEQESNEYFNSRPIGSQIGACASPQSQVIASREILENNTKQLEEKYAINNKINRPQHWGGYIVQPTQIEFWQGRPSRLHDRILYTLQANQSWKIERLAP
jgi:pyridoxamine 5'-phosphate oxidase